MDQQPTTYSRFYMFIPIVLLLAFMISCDVETTQPQHSR
jgi:hypothetical protein